MFCGKKEYTSALTYVWEVDVSTGPENGPMVDLGAAAPVLECFPATVSRTMDSFSDSAIHSTATQARTHSSSGQALLQSPTRSHKHEHIHTSSDQGRLRETDANVHS